MQRINPVYSTLVIILILVSAVCAQTTLKVGDVVTPPGQKQSGFINIPAGEDSPAHGIPVTVIHGKKAGPVLALIAGVHGYEYPPILALQRLAKKIDPGKISGSIIMVHVANMPSFMQRTIYYNPYDGVNLNRAFPGKEKGTSSERIAYHLTKEVIDKCDVLIDMHCGDGNEDLISYLYNTKVGDPELDARTRALAEAYGLKVIVGDLGRPTDPNASVYCGNTALLKGKPSITTESGKLGTTDEYYIQEVIRGTYNVMKHLDMIPGEPVILAEPVWVQEYKIIRAENDGLFYPLVNGGHHVQKDEKVGYLTDFFGNTIQEVRAPFNGIVLYIIGTPPMNKGEPMVSVGRF